MCLTFCVVLSVAINLHCSCRHFFRFVDMVVLTPPVFSIQYYLSSIALWMDETLVMYPLYRICCCLLLHPLVWEFCLSFVDRGYFRHQKFIAESGQAFCACVFWYHMMCANHACFGPVTVARRGAHKVSDHTTHMLLCSLCGAFWIFHTRFGLKTPTIPDWDQLMFTYIEL